MYKYFLLFGLAAVLFGYTAEVFAQDFSQEATEAFERGQYEEAIDLMQKFWRRTRARKGRPLRTTS